MSEVIKTLRTVWRRVRDELHHGHVGWSFLTFFLLLSLGASALLNLLSLPTGLLLLVLPAGWVSWRAAHRLEAGNEAKARLASEVEDGRHRR